MFPWQVLMTEQVDPDPCVVLQEFPCPSKATEHEPVA
jgi:hypothetical protein